MPEFAQKVDSQPDQESHKAADADGKSSPVTLQADGRASAAALRRMAQGGQGEAVGGDTDPKTKAPSNGDSGMLTRELEAKLDGKDVKLMQGTYVVVKQVAGKNLVVKCYSAYGGKEATVPIDAFKAEPELAHKSDPGHTAEPHDFVYKEYTSILWDGAPKAGDVAQGRLGDCYLISAMGAVAAANPKAIMNCFSPHTPNQTQYTVTLHLPDGRGGFKKNPVVVDTALPTKIEEVQMNAPTYALKGKNLGNHNVPIWPGLLEKAYAQMVGGYDDAGDKGGYSNVAMEAITGVRSRPETVKSKDEEILADFKSFQKDGKAVVCGTLGSKHAKSQSGFRGSGEGPYSATLMSDQGDPASIVPGSLKVADKGGKAKRAWDSDGKILGGATGTVAYRQGQVSLQYKSGEGPAKAEDLEAEYDWRGLLDKTAQVYAWHAYIFESVTPDGKLQFKNPWGSSHPNPLAPADFRRLFTGINTNAVPKEKEGGN